MKFRRRRIAVIGFVLAQTGGLTDANEQVVSVTGNRISGAASYTSWDALSHYLSNEGFDYAGPEADNPYAEQPAEDEPIVEARVRPRCDRELKFKQAVIDAASRGEPLSSPQSAAQLLRLMAYTEWFLPMAARDLTDLLSGGVKDSEYQNPEWRKMEYVFWGTQYADAASAAARVGGVQFMISIHYWWNSRTFAVEQAKFKNPVESGCAGDPSATAYG